VSSEKCGKKHESTHRDILLGYISRIVRYRYGFVAKRGEEADCEPIVPKDADQAKRKDCEGVQVRTNERKRGKRCGRL
jgi:hypothetical protein